jgi:hypothetical protein
MTAAILVGAVTCPVCRHDKLFPEIPGVVPGHPDGVGRACPMSGKAL